MSLVIEGQSYTLGAVIREWLARLWSITIFAPQAWRSHRIQMVLGLAMFGFWLVLQFTDVSMLTGGPWDPAYSQTEWFQHAIQWDPEYSYLETNAHFEA